jgi:hypothetical protein
MEKKKFTTFEKLVFFVYGYFIIIGVLWLSASLFFGGGFSYWAFSLIAIFGTQAYFKQKLTNLIIGVLCLAVSIFGSLEFASLGHKTSFDGFVNIMLGVCLTSLLMSIVLIFSYTKLSFGSE